MKPSRHDVAALFDSPGWPIIRDLLRGALQDAMLEVQNRGVETPPAVLHKIKILSELIDTLRILAQEIKAPDPFDARRT